MQPDMERERKPRRGEPRMVDLYGFDSTLRHEGRPGSTHALGENGRLICGKGISEPINLHRRGVPSCKICRRHLGGPKYRHQVSQDKDRSPVAQIRPLEPLHLCAERIGGAIGPVLTDRQIVYTEDANESGHRHHGMGYECMRMPSCSDLACKAIGRNSRLSWSCEGCLWHKDMSKVIWMRPPTHRSEE